MRQLTFVAPRRLEWWDVPAPVVEAPGEALVRPIASTTCDLDHWIIQGEFPFPGPFPIGHECVAEVLDTGDRVSSVRPGDVVVVPWHISCGECDRCRSGTPAHCRTTPATASYGVPFGGQWGGTFDDVVRVPYTDAMLVRIPAGIDPHAVVSAGDNLAIPLELLGGHLQRHPGASVLVLGREGPGSGSVSLFAAQTAAALGAGRVVYVDADLGRRAMLDGSDLIVTDPGPPRRELGRFDILFDCSTSPEALRAGIRRLNPDGVVECPGGHHAPVTLDLFEMYTRGVTLHTGLANARQYIEPIFDLVLQRRIEPLAVLGEPQPMDDAAVALAEPSTKPLFVRDPTTRTPSPAPVVRSRAPAIRVDQQ